MVSSPARQWSDILDCNAAPKIIVWLNWLGSTLKHVLSRHKIAAVAASAKVSSCAKKSGREMNLIQDIELESETSRCPLTPAWASASGSPPFCTHVSQGCDFRVPVLGLIENRKSRTKILWKEKQCEENVAQEGLIPRRFNSDEFAALSAKNEQMMPKMSIFFVLSWLL